MSEKIIKIKTNYVNVPLLFIILRVHIIHKQLKYYPTLKKPLQVFTFTLH